MNQPFLFIAASVRHATAAVGGAKFTKLVRQNGWQLSPARLCFDVVLSLYMETSSAATGITISDTKAADTMPPTSVAAICFVTSDPAPRPQYL
jgi:hypothetical protein